jgi:hypothetical protein
MEQRRNPNGNYSSRELMVGVMTMNREELLRAKALMTQQDKNAGRILMRLGAGFIIAGFGSLAIIFLLYGTLTGTMSIFAYIFAIPGGVGIAMVLFGALQYSSSND